MATKRFKLVYYLARERVKLLASLAAMTAGDRRRWRPTREQRFVLMDPRSRKQALRRNKRDIWLKFRAEKEAAVAAHHQNIRDTIDPKYLSSHARAMRGLKVALEARAS